MAGRRSALIASDGHNTLALAGILGDPQRGGYTVSRAADSDGVAEFLGEQDATDVVLVVSDGVRVDPAALAACRSTHVVVLVADPEAGFDAPPGSAVLAGAPTASLVRSLRDGRADGNADGDITL